MHRFRSYDALVALRLFKPSDMKHVRFTKQPATPPACFRSSAMRTSEEQPEHGRGLESLSLGPLPQPHPRRLPVRELDAGRLQRSADRGKGGRLEIVLTTFKPQDRPLRHATPLGQLITRPIEQAPSSPALRRAHFA